ncbi:MAG TPA: hypothetical protein VFI16_05720 [Anaeromyxobacteraceae bacterium]|nr:hypothetical protein [Anaeromyxobacteraceae bacterium]
MRASRLALLVAIGAAGLALAQGTPPQGDRTSEIPLEVKVGETRSLCPCPVRRFMCDDGSLVKLVEDPAGQSLEGLKPGATLCSLDGPTGRRLYRVKVVERGAGRK